uniref:Uncharacterized protein n=1 Tax=Geobacillus sp. (strain WCH70) TaxID=471223 RepID=C5DA26_GEOSW
MDIRAILKRVSHQDMIELMMGLIALDKKAKERALQFLEEKGYLNDEQLAQKYYHEYRDKFAETIDIISEFNMYGGGLQEEEYRAYENMEHILSLLEDGKLPDECREEMIHELMEQYLEGNSGFDDDIWDWIEQIACEEEHWHLILSYLERSNSKYDQSLMLKIYQHKLGDEDTYELMRMQQLTYGSDYWDYVQFLHRKGEVKKALDIAEQGLEKGQGALDTLYEYVFRHYDQIGEKGKALQLLKRYFQHRPSYELYKKTISYAEKSEKEAVRKELYSFVSDLRYSSIKAEIDYQEGNSQELLRYVTRDAPYAVYSRHIIYERYLQESHPSEMIAYYKQKAEAFIAKKNRKAYRYAVEYIKEIRHVYINILKQPKEWETYYQRVIVPHQSRLPAFLDEWNKRREG